MSKINQKDLKAIMSVDRKMSPEEHFAFLLGEIGSHIEKLKKLKAHEDKPGHFKEEVCDMYILSRLLFELEHVSQEELNKASRHFADKVLSIYKK